VVIEFQGRISDKDLAGLQNLQKQFGEIMDRVNHGIDHLGRDGDVHVRKFGFIRLPNYRSSSSSLFVSDNVAAQENSPLLVDPDSVQGVVRKVYGVIESWCRNGSDSAKKEGLGQPQHASLPDRYYIEEAALRYMLDKHSRSPAERASCSAYVLEQGEFTSQLLASFQHYKPIVTTNIQFSTDSGMALDKATGKRVKLWSVEIREIDGDVAVAHVTWYSGRRAAGGHTIELRRKQGIWVVQSERKDWVS
jgi:hypothetical protein